MQLILLRQICNLKEEPDMRAAVYESFGGPITIETVPDPTPPPGGVVIRVGATGLCRSDWHGWMGHDPSIALPHVPGHELAGTVAASTLLEQVHALEKLGVTEGSISWPVLPHNDHAKGQRNYSDDDSGAISPATA